MDDQDVQKLASSALRLRTAVSVALVALAEVEQTASDDDTRERARSARLAIRDALKTSPG